MDHPARVTLRQKSSITISGRSIFARMAMEKKGFMMQQPMHGIKEEKYDNEVSSHFEAYLPDDE